MGYTHYWNFKKPSKGTAMQVEKQYQLALRQCRRLLQSYNANLKLLNPKHPDRLSGYSVHSKGYGGLFFNGTAELSHEDFVLREHYNQNLVNDYFGFCKTAYKPYDLMVTGCLLILNHYLKSNITISSDGYAHNWAVSLILVQRILGLTSIKIPDTIKSITDRNTA